MVVSTTIHGLQYLPCPRVGVSVSLRRGLVQTVGHKQGFEAYLTPEKPDSCKSSQYNPILHN